MLNTFEVKWQSVNHKHPDSECIRITRVLTNSAQRAAEYVKSLYPADFIKAQGVELIPKAVPSCSCECHK